MIKDGPIDFYVKDTDSYLSSVALRCIHLGEKQPMTKTEVQFLIGRGDVFLDGKVVHRIDSLVSSGVHTLKIRDRIHHVRVLGTLEE